MHRVYTPRFSFSIERFDFSRNGDLEMKSIRNIFLSALLLAAPLFAQQWKAPTGMKKLSNGLTVVVSEDHSAPTFGVCISYGIGFRLEPEGRTGFAHLFEHMMFEGTPVAPKGTLIRVIEGGGGNLNGDTLRLHRIHRDRADLGHRPRALDRGRPHEDPRFLAQES